MQRTRRSSIVAGAAAMLALGVASPGLGAATSTVAAWEMNESSTATTMFDTGPNKNNIHGSIGDEVRPGVVASGATGYFWSKVGPNTYPATQERLVTVHDSRLNPGSGDYAVTMRFRTEHSAGNIIQKGQSGTAGGYFKWQIPQGKVTCLFRGRAADGTVQSKSVNSGDVPLNDGAWHVLTCERTASGPNAGLALTIDGSKTRRASGPTGTITNSAPLTLGGKFKCDQVKVTCDYFSGDIDYVRISNAG